MPRMDPACCVSFRSMPCGDDIEGLPKRFQMCHLDLTIRNQRAHDLRPRCSRVAGHGYLGRLRRLSGACHEPRHDSDRSSCSCRCRIDSNTLVWVGEPRARSSNQCPCPTSISLQLGSVHGEFYDDCSVLDFHIGLHIHDVLAWLAHHLRLRLWVRVRSMCHHGHLAGMADLWCVAWVSI